MRKILNAESGNSSPVSGGSVADANAVRESGQSAMLSDAGNEVATVLVVEDMEINRQLVKILLGSLQPGLVFLEASNGVEAVEIVKKEKVDLVLMDIKMPEMDGIEATRIIREWEKDVGTGKPMPLIALTAGALKEEKEKALNCGMDDFLSKPIIAEKLKNMLQKYLGAFSDQKKR